MEPEHWLDYCRRRPTQELFTGLERVAGRHSRCETSLLAHLAEIDNREAALEKGYSSLFVYCTRKLGFSESEAFHRIRAARAAANFPRILTMLAKRQIHIGAVSKLYPHLRPENYRSLLDRASRRTLEELDRLLAELAPLPEKRPVIRTISTGSPSPPGYILPAAGVSGPHPGPSELSLDCASRPESPRPPRPSAETPAGRVLFNFVGPESLRRKFVRARELMRHKFPYGLPEQLFEDALDALLDRKDPDRRIARAEARARARAKRRETGRGMLIRLPAEARGMDSGPAAKT